MTITLNGTTGITTPAVTNDGAYTGDGVVFADGTPSNTLVTTTGGNVGIGTSSITDGSGWGRIVQLYKSNYAAYSIKTDTAQWDIANYQNALTFWNGTTERMRIDSSGNLLVGTTSASPNYGNTGVVIFPSGRTAVQRNVNGTDSVFQAFGNAGAFYVQGNGNCLNTNNSYGSLSDLKLKENIVDATPKLEKLNQVRVVNYNLKGETQKQIGVVAQELEQIFPSMIEEMTDRDADGNDLGTTTKSVKYSVFVPMLIKAVQELKAELDTVKTELATLKGTA